MSMQRPRERDTSRMHARCGRTNAIACCVARGGGASADGASSGVLCEWLGSARPKQRCGVVGLAVDAVLGAVKVGDRPAEASECKAGRVQMLLDCVDSELFVVEPRGRDASGACIVC